MAQCVSFEELQGEAPSLNQAGVRLYGAKVPRSKGITIETLGQLADVLEFEPDKGRYAYTSNSHDANTVVTMVLVYWTESNGKVRYPPPKVKKEPELKTLI